MTLTAISLWQPYATLVAIGAKTIETRSWSTKHRGPLAIHAGLRRPPLMHLPPLCRGRSDEDRQRDRETWFVVDTITDPAFQGPRPEGSHTPKRATRPTLFYPHDGPHGRPWDKSAGTSATEQGTAMLLPLGAIVATCQLVDVVPVESIVWKPGGSGWLRIPAADAEMPHDYIESYEGERAFGDYAPGRYAWMLDSISPVPRPIACRGRQGLWSLPDEAAQCLG